MSPANDYQNLAVARKRNNRVPNHLVPHFFEIESLSTSRTQPFLLINFFSRQGKRIATIETPSLDGVGNETVPKKCGASLARLCTAAVASPARRWSALDYHPLRSSG